MNSFKKYMTERKEIVEKKLGELMEESQKDPSSLLARAMAYSLGAGGKRLRPVLCLSSYEIASGKADISPALPIACAYEFVHTASLIHDDLPCMDDDVLRRGNPTNHVVFGEAIALLAGDGLFTWAYEYGLSGSIAMGLPAERALLAVRELAVASGPSGMTGGQCLDIDPLTHRGEISLFEYTRKMASLKTGAMIKGCIMSGAYAGGADDVLLKILDEYGKDIGLAFQVVDDILDVIGTTEQLGKTPGKDADQDKLTFVAAMGLEGAKEYAAKLLNAARKSADSLGDKGWFLSELCEYLGERKG